MVSCNPSSEVIEVNFFKPGISVKPLQFLRFTFSNYVKSDISGNLSIDVQLSVLAGSKFGESPAIDNILRRPSLSLALSTD